MEERTYSSAVAEAISSLAIGIFRSQSVSFRQDNISGRQTMSRDKRARALTNKLHPRSEKFSPKTFTRLNGARDEDDQESDCETTGNSGLEVWYVRHIGRSQYVSRYPLFRCSAKGERELTVEVGGGRKENSKLREILPKECLLTPSVIGKVQGLSFAVYRLSQ